MCSRLWFKSWWLCCGRLYSMLFAKYMLKEIKCAGLFRLWVGLYFTQNYCFVFQLHIELGFFTPQNSKYKCCPAYDTAYTTNHTCDHHTLSKPRDWSTYCACVRVDVVSARCSCFRHLSTMLYQYCVWELIRLYIVFYSIIHVYIAVIRNVTGQSMCMYRGFSFKTWSPERNPVVSRGTSVFAN